MSDNKAINKDSVMPDAAERGETTRTDGQHTAYRVMDIRYSSDWRSEEETYYMGTLWDKAEAEVLRDAIDPHHAEPGWPGSRIEEIGVIVVGENAYYATDTPPVPVGLVAESAAEAARDFVAWNKGWDIPQALAQLAINA